MKMAVIPFKVNFRIELERVFDGELSFDTKFELQVLKCFPSNTIQKV